MSIENLPEDKEFVTLPMIARACAFDYRTLSYWLVKGFFKPSIDNAGSGNTKLYSRGDAELIFKLVVLRRNGMGVVQLGEVAKHLRSGGHVSCPICGEGEIRVG